MKRIFTIGFLSLTLSLVYAQKPGNWMYTCFLFGDEEVPAVMTNGRGYATFLVDKELKKLQISGVFTHLSSDITACHLHIAEQGNNGPTFLDLKSYLKGNKLQATIDLPDGFLFVATQNFIYINVHTTNFPTGEIRGQLSLQSEFQFASVMLGANSIPPVGTIASGLGLFQIDFNKDVLEYHIQLTNLSGPIRSAHIHDGDQASNGPVLFDLNGSGNILSGEISLATVDPADFLKILFGNTYVNVHTDANPSGEIRGQIGYAGPFHCGTILNGDQEVPPVTTSATGSSFIFPNPTLDTLTYITLYDGLSGQPTGAHVHFSEVGKNGPVIIPLNPSPIPGIYFGQVVIDKDNLANLTNGLFYINIHTSAHPGGEIRGQILTNLRKSYAFDLCGAQSVPVNNSNGYGVVGISIDQANTNLDYGLIHSEFTSNSTAAHIHSGSKGTNGGVLFEIVLQQNIANQIIAVTGNDVLQIEAGNTYVNVHTEDFPSGEIRGQVDQKVSCIITSVSDLEKLENVHLTPNPATDFVNIDFGAFINEPLQVNIYDLNGKNVYVQKYYGGNKTSIDLTSINNGVYTLELLSTKSNQIKSNQKFIVIK